MYQHKTIVFLFSILTCLSLQAEESTKTIAVLQAVQETETVEGPQLTQQAQALLDEVNKRIENIDTNSLKTLLENEPDTVLIDVRTPAEINLLGGSIDSNRHFNILRSWLDLQIDNFISDKNTPIVVYCGVNQRSPLAADTLNKLGYTNVKNYSGGFFNWKNAGLPVKMSDEALDSFLYSKPVEVIPGVWSAIGATAPPTYDNSGHNNNLSFIITDDGVLVVNAGDNYLLAQELHEEIKKITDQPVKYVVLENGQGHAMLGSNYWKEQGVPVIAHKDAAAVIEKDGEEILQRMQRRSRDKAFKTALVMPDEVFDEKKTIKMGKKTIELLYLGPAHSPGDVMVWLPGDKLIITGDMAFHERLLPVFEDTVTSAWLETWEKFVALGAETVIPGHGHTTNMEEVTKYTKDYLVFMRQQVQAILDEGGLLNDAYNIDQSRFSHLDTFFELNRSNAGEIFRQMEFE